VRHFPSIRGGGDSLPPLMIYIKSEPLPKASLGLFLIKYFQPVFPRFYFPFAHFAYFSPDPQRGKTKAETKALSMKINKFVYSFSRLLFGAIFVFYFPFFSIFFVCLFSGRCWSRDSPTDLYGLWNGAGKTGKH